MFSRYSSGLVCHFVSVLGVAERTAFTSLSAFVLGNQTRQMWRILLIENAIQHCSRGSMIEDCTDQTVHVVTQSYFLYVLAHHPLGMRAQSPLLYPQKSLDGTLDQNNEHKWELAFPFWIV